MSLSDPADEASAAVPTPVWTAAHAVSKFYKLFGSEILSSIWAIGEKLPLQKPIP